MNSCFEMPPKRKRVSANMAANVNSKPGCWKVPEVYKHHEQHNACFSRPKYRDGRRAKAVKVYTINLESRYVMIQGVPAIGVMEELIQLCALYGTVEEYRPLDEYPAEEFTEVYLVKFQKLTSARAAKRNMDEKSFYGGVLHVCYVPEYESVEDTKLKLQDRRSYVLKVARSRAKERVADAVHMESTSSESVPTSSRVFATNNPIFNSDKTGETSSFSHCSGFPLLPLPPQEYFHQDYRGNEPTEDQMGTLHDAVPPDVKQQKVQNFSSFSKDPNSEKKLASNPDSSVKLVPRTAHLEKNKRRKMEEATKQPVPDSGEPSLIGPKLPEPHKLDMNDQSLNTTVNLIRGTMKQVTSVPDLKPAEKKVKPRRRI
ncbi:RNA-binding protein 48 isoform X1 [Oryzias latipes]|uniref:RNA-binding protein 48 n=2 Tax=Oryzias latipes TaxID=8090 RepID=H2M5S1_ORYLA